MSKTLVTLLYFFFLVTISNAQSFRTVENTSTYQLQIIDSNYFNSHRLKSKTEFDTSTRAINVQNATTILPLTNGKTVRLRSIDYPALVDYTYQGLFKKYRLYLVQVSYPEYYYYYLINDSTGKIDTLQGQPEFSPLGNYFATNVCVRANSMLEMHITNRKTGKSIIITCPDETERPDMDWEWENDTTLLFYGYSLAKDDLVYYRLIMK